MSALVFFRDYSARAGRQTIDRVSSAQRLPADLHLPQRKPRKLLDNAILENIGKKLHNMDHFYKTPFRPKSSRTNFYLSLTDKIAPKVRR
jgi:hypothetical protein